MVTISLCMIVRNEEAVLCRCLDSVQDLVDEIIIVDTGSTDNTKELARMYTDHVYDFPWINDFSAARNASFEKAAMDYCMWMDADDILPLAQKEKLLTWKHQTDSHLAPDVVMLKYAAAFDQKQTPSFLYYRERLLRRDRGFIWKGRVHEAITPSGQIDYLDIYLEHHSTKTVYSDRNLQIYEEMKTTNVPFTPRDQFYYARELYYHGQYQRAIDNFTLFLEMPGAFVENQVDACRLAAYCCYPLGDEKQALQFLLQGLSYRVPGGELCCDIGKHFLDRKHFEEAIFWYRGALQAPQKTENGGFVEKECYGYLPCLQLSVCYDKLGRFDEAIRFHRLAGVYNPTGELYLKNHPYFLQIENAITLGTLSCF